MTAAYRLTPRADWAWHAAWLASTHVGPCIVTAGSEAEARRLASCRFAARPDPIAGEPWTRSEMVHVVQTRRAGPPAGWVAPILGRLGG